MPAPFARLCGLLLFLSTLSAQSRPDLMFEMAGVPIQLAWADVNRDGLQDLVALMLETRTQGQMDTWLSDGELRGLYTDQVFREKYLATFVQVKDGWQLWHKFPLGQVGVLGFALSDDGAATHLMLWKNTELRRHKWSNQTWEFESEMPTPGLLAEDAAFLSDFPFWFENQQGAYWLVPDFAGIHLIEWGRASRFLPYPPESLLQSELDELGHKFKLSLPKLLRVNQDSIPDLVFHSGNKAIAYPLNDPGRPIRMSSQGMLADFNGDGMVDLLKAEADDVEKMKDLPKITTKVKTFLATAPFQFEERATADQTVPGMVLDGSDSSIQLAQPFLDINRDGRCDLAGFAIKISAWKAGMMLVTGRMSIQFLLSLSLQMADGSFKTLAGSPFTMEWKLNLRRMQMPSLAEFTADFDGDGWSDLLMVKETRLEVTAIGPNGLAPKPWIRKLPAVLKDPDQVYGRDLEGDGKASFVVIKLDKGKTIVGILERTP